MKSFFYLDELQKHTLNDYGLEGEETVILKAFLMMKRFIKSSHISALTLNDWVNFGLSKKIIKRINRRS